MIDREGKVFLTGHKGMVGSKLLTALQESGYNNIITTSHAELDLREQEAVNNFIKEKQPQYIIHLAAKVGGINANIKNPAIFLYDNLMMQANLIHAAYINNVRKFFFLGSSCIYPKECPQPMKEEYLLTGKLEPTNEGYAIGKIAGIKLLESYYKQYGFRSVSLMPSNLYGPNDSFDLSHAHVLSSLVRRFCDAKEEELPSVTLWGTGKAKREFLHVSDLVQAILYFFENHDNYEFINVGPGNDISIYELAHMIAKKINYTGLIKWDTTKPDGMLRKCMDVTKMKNLGFEPAISLSYGIDEVIKSYKTQKINQI